MMHARTLLFRQLQQFFEQFLTGRWRISDVVFELPKLAPKERGIRQRPHEIVTGMFGDYTISMHSTTEHPPLGRIVCTDLHGHSVEGVIDEQTWREIAAMIKPYAAERKFQHVNGH
jgi:hypothetical protein